MTRSTDALHRAALAAALLLTAACTTVPEATTTEPEGPMKTTVVVVPAASDGHVGSVVARSGDRTEVLDTAYATAESTSDGELTARTLTAEEVQDRFGGAAAALPRAATRFILQFELGTDRLTRASRSRFEAIADELAGRQAGDIRVEGHTDRQGTEANNLALSKRRAEKVRDDLVRAGFDARIITAIGLGESRPLVQTADEVPEPRNRRVELYVR